jgi:hypothetical protein
MRMDLEQIKALVKTGKPFIYHLRANANWRDFGNFQSLLQHCTDWPINGGLGLKNNFELCIHKNIFFPIHIIPMAWSVIRSVEEE